MFIHYEISWDENVLQWRSTQKVGKVRKKMLTDLAQVDKDKTYDWNEL